MVILEATWKLNAKLVDRPIWLTNLY